MNITNAASAEGGNATKMKRDISGEFARDARTRSVRSGFDENIQNYMFKKK